MRTTVTLDDELLAQAKLLAARTHRTIGSILEDALRRFLEEQGTAPAYGEFRLPRLDVVEPGLQAGVDLEDREQTAELLGDNDHALP